MQKNGPFALAFNLLVVAFVLAPLVIVCLVAFTPASTLSIPTTAFSLRWFRAVFAHADFMQALRNSLWLAFCSASIATLLAIPAAIAITRYRFPGRDALNGLFLSPLMIPTWCWAWPCCASLRSWAPPAASDGWRWRMWW